MSFVTWHNYGYGIRVTDIRSEDLNRLKSLLHLAPEYEAKINKWLEESIEEEVTYADYMEYDEDYCLGLATLLHEVIWEAEGISLVACDDFDGNTYLLYEPSYPWECPEKDRTLTEEDIRLLFSKYVRILTDEEIIIDYYAAENGG